MHRFWCVGELYLPQKTHKNVNNYNNAGGTEKMRVNQWTLGLVAAGVVSAASVSRGEEAPSQVLTALSSTTLSGYVDTSAIWKIGSDHGKGSFIPGRSFDNAGKMDGFNLNVVKLILEKPLDEGQWSAGYRV